MYKVALVGCGRISKNHIAAIKDNPIFQLVAVCDKDGKKLAKVARDNRVNGYFEIGDMCRREEIDIISVLVEAGNHAKVACQAAEYGKHVITEKPMALTMKDADQMIATCKDRGVSLFVVKQNRFNLPILKLKEALDAGRFGKLTLGTIRLRWARHKEYFDMDAWRGTWALDGGVFASQASHHVDMLRWLMGPVRSVYAIARNSLLDIEAEDTGIATIEFESGAIGVIEATNAARPTNIEGSVSILGEHGTVVVGGMAMNKIETWLFDDKIKDTLGEYDENPPDVYGFGHKRFYEAVAEAMDGRGSQAISGEESRKSLELICAIYESIDTGKKVVLGFHPEKLRLGK